MTLLGWFSTKPELCVTHNLDSLSTPVEITYRKVKLGISVEQAYEAHQQLTKAIKGIGRHDRIRLQRHGADRVTTTIGGIRVEIPFEYSIDVAEQFKRTADTVLKLTHWSGLHREFARQPQGNRENKQET